MKILVIESSPHQHGSSNLLAGEFIRGAKESGHEVTVFDAGHADLHPCLGCGACGMAGPCVQKDDMAAFQEQLMASDMAVFVTPLYYFGFSAQLKTRHRPLLQHKRTADGKRTENCTACRGLGQQRLDDAGYPGAL